MTELIQFFSNNYVAVLQIIWIDILLSGDNAVVIAMACRGLPEHQRKWGIILGAGAGILLRILFTLVATSLMDLPWLKIIGSVLLFWVAIKLITDDNDGHDIKAESNLFNAIKVIAVADAVMSLDNVIAVAAAAHGSWPLIIFGLIVSIPLMIFGAQLIMSVLEKFPLLIWAGAALLGWIAGELLVSDPAVVAKYGVASSSLKYACAVAGAAFVVAVGMFVKNRRKHA